MQDQSSPSRPQSDMQDVIIIGAGLSGVGMACRLKMSCPEASFTVLEARDRIGGTWDLFRYPGVRSDSDMHTLGYPFRPWSNSNSIADGQAIRDYIEDTAHEYGIDWHIRFGTKAVAADWSSESQCWTVAIEEEGRQQTITCRFLIACAGYYDYDQGYTPEFKGIEDFGGVVIHPQVWPEDLSLKDRHAVVIGSGATAITLVPALAELAGHVTMLQRSPSYVVAQDKDSRLARSLRRMAPRVLADGMIRWHSILLNLAQYGFARWQPKTAREHIKKDTQNRVGPSVDTDTHFEPDYNVWDQRVCLDPDAAFFSALKEGHASICTAHIHHFDENGIVLENGERIDTDLVITATGLKIKVFGGLTLHADGEPINLSDRIIYKGMMVEGVPNFGFCFGYTNASWTLKANLSARHICRTLEYMRARDYGSFAPVAKSPARETIPLINFSSGYIQRAADIIPKQGEKAPWRVHQNYLADLSAYTFGKVNDGVLQFEKAKQSASATIGRERKIASG